MEDHIQERRKSLNGLFGIAGIWFTVGVSVPLINILKEFSPWQLLTARGIVTAVLSLVIARNKVWKVDRNTWLLAIFFALASVGLFNSIRELGASFTIILFTTTPAVNFVLTWMRREHISWATISTLIFLLLGVAIALKVWELNTSAQIYGLAWGIGGLIMNGLFIDVAGRSQSSRLTRCFWQGIMLSVLGIVTTYLFAWQATMLSVINVSLLIFFAVTFGLLNFLSNFQAFDNLPSAMASVLAQGATPFTILVSGILLGEHLSLLQWIGIAIGLVAATYLSRWLMLSSKKVAA